MTAVKSSGLDEIGGRNLWAQILSVLVSRKFWDPPGISRLDFEGKRKDSR